MKQLIVSDDCVGCGLCVLNCNYLVEDTDGNAYFEPGKTIKDEDLDLINKTVLECPNSALTLTEIKTTDKKGKEGQRDLMKALRDFSDNFHVKRIDIDEVMLDIKNYYIDKPYSNKEYSDIYNSESQARSAATEEFKRLCYSESAFKPILKKIFVEYKIKVLKPYYTFDDKSESYYLSYNKAIKAFLENIYAEAQELSGSYKIPHQSWINFNVKLSVNNFSLIALKEFDERSTNSGIIADLKNRSKYTSLDWYINRMNFACNELYDGEGLFGKTKYKTTWYFSDFYTQVKEFIEDLKSSIDSKSYEISNVALNDINSVLDDYEQLVKDSLKNKAIEFERIIEG